MSEQLQLFPIEEIENEVRELAIDTIKYATATLADVSQVIREIKEENEKLASYITFLLKTYDLCSDESIYCFPDGTMWSLGYE